MKKMTDFIKLFCATGNFFKKNHFFSIKNGLNCNYTEGLCGGEGKLELCWS